MEKQKVMVMSASRYKMVDTSTGEINQGTTVRFLCTDKLEPCQDGESKGYRFGKTSIGYDEFEALKVVPGIYTADFNINIASDGTMKVKAGNFEYVGPVALPAAK